MNTLKITELSLAQIEAEVMAEGKNGRGGEI